MPADLDRRFDVVLGALESDGAGVTNRITPGKIRRRPLETARVELPSGAALTVPTAEEALGIKAFLVVRRNRTRDHLGVVALAESLYAAPAAATLARIDDRHADQHGRGDGVASQVARQLAQPRPADISVTRELHRYRNLAPRWHDRDAVTSACRRLATAMADPAGP